MVGCCNGEGGMSPSRVLHGYVSPFRTWSEHARCRRFRRLPVVAKHFCALTTTKSIFVSLRYSSLMTFNEVKAAPLKSKLAPELDRVFVFVFDAWAKSRDSVRFVRKIFQYGRGFNI